MYCSAIQQGKTITSVPKILNDVTSYCSWTYVFCRDIASFGQKLMKIDNCHLLWDLMTLCCSEMVNVLVQMLKYCNIIDKCIIIIIFKLAILHAECLRIC